MDSGDVDSMFLSLGNKLGWFVEQQNENIDSAIECLRKSTKKKTKEKNRKTDKPVTKRKQNVSSSVKTLKSTPPLSDHCSSSLSCTTTTTDTDVAVSGKVEGENDKINSVKQHEKNLLSLSSIQGKEKKSPDVSSTSVGHRRVSLTKLSDVSIISDDSVTNTSTSSNNICKKISFNNSDDSPSLNSEFEKSARIINNSSCFRQSFERKSSSSEATSSILSVSDDHNNNTGDQCDRSNNSIENDVRETKKENESTDLSDDDDDDDDLENFIQKMLTPRKISMDNSNKKLLGNYLSNIEHEKKEDFYLNPINNKENRFGKQQLETSDNKTNNKRDGKKYIRCLEEEIPKQNRKYILQDKNSIDSSPQSEGCNSSSDDDDFEVFLEKMKTPLIKKTPLHLQTPLSEFIVSSSDESSQDGDESLSFYHHTQVISTKTDKLSLPNAPSVGYIEKSSPIEERRLDSDKDEINSSLCTSKSSTSIFKAPSINFAQTEIKKDPALRLTLSTSHEVTSKKTDTFSLKQHLWTDPNLKSNRSQPKTETELYATFLKSLSLSTANNPIDPSAQKYIKYFKRNHVELVSKLFKIYNETVFEGYFPSDFSIRWNKRLLTTAGHCILKSKYSNKNCERKAEICLATKICDTAERVRDTLLHEMCHAAVWLVNGSREGHGRLWKAWAYKAHKAFPYLPLVKRCHSYDIAKKFTYRCIRCGYSFGRHSKSLDTTKKVCGYCRGQFELVLSNCTPTSTPSRTPNKFALFVKEHYGSVKKQEKCSHKEVMKLLGEQFKEVKL